jgi:hypothetical protein
LAFDKPIDPQLVEEGEHGRWKAVVSVRHVSAPVAPLSSIFLLAFVGQLGAPAYRSSQPSAPCSTDQHQDERSNYDPDQRVLWQWWWRSRRIAHGASWSILAPLQQLKVS